MKDPGFPQQPSMQDQPVDPALGLRSFGHVEALDIRRRSRKHPELLLFKGSPGSKHSAVKSVLITINGAGEAMPSPWLDKEKGRIHLCYPSLEHPELQALVADPGGFVCYFWSSADGAKSHAWLLRTR